jgi:hypothetical protein
MNPEFFLVILGATAVLTVLSVVIGMSSDSLIASLIPQIAVLVIAVGMAIASAIVGGWGGLGLMILAITAGISSMVSLVLSLAFIFVIALVRN